MKYLLPVASVALALSLAGAAQAADHNRGHRGGDRDHVSQQWQQPQQGPGKQGWQQNNNGPRRGPIFNNNDHRKPPVANNNWRDDNARADWRQFRRNVQAPKRFRAGAYHGPRNFNYHRWSYGERLPSVYFSRPYWLLNTFIYGLATPPSGLVWVRYGDDALLVDRYSGEIVQVRYNVFY